MCPAMGAKFTAQTTAMPLVALLRPHPLEPLEGKSQVVAHAAVENGKRALASLRDQRVAAAGHPHQRSRHRIRHAAPVGLGHRNAIRAGNGRRAGHELLDRAGADHHAHFIGLLVGDDARCVARRNELPAGDAPAGGALAVTAGKHLQQAGGCSARRRREGIVPDLDHPGALADREASQRDGVAGIELPWAEACPRSASAIVNASAAAPTTIA